jgi:mRNA-degrading endonuclease HigB of HigAB toxin-antitoxin module
MRIVGQGVLDKFLRKHVDARRWIEVWLRTVHTASWSSLDDVRRAYPHADGVKLKSGNVVTVFNCKGNEYRLLTYITYAIQAVEVLEVIPHAEYSEDGWKARH